VTEQIRTAAAASHSNFLSNTSIPLQGCSEFSLATYHDSNNACRGPNMLQMMYSAQADGFEVRQQLIFLLCCIPLPMNPLFVNYFILFYCYFHAAHACRRHRPLPISVPVSPVRLRASTTGLCSGPGRCLMEAATKPPGRCRTTSERTVPPLLLSSCLAAEAERMQLIFVLNFVLISRWQLRLDSL
jgi:hypothetical protein